tara:strand:+ start:394 stop:609 length:216 start_codon:yes stop_codon:yes gene_type:complete
MRKIKMTRQMTKKEWLDEMVFRDLYGRTYNLSDVPMTMMSRKESFEKQGVTSKQINEFWKENKQDYLIKVG